ncbi:MAG: photosystem II complex extrinsic protein PsbU [Cyanobacteria bacterium P01_H01_bin.15]
MNRFFSILFTGILLVGIWVVPGQLTVSANSVEFQPLIANASAKGGPIRSQNAADRMLDSDYGQKIDLNNANVRKFRTLPGFYPTLAQSIVQNAPYDSVEDVLSIPNLSERQKERLQANLDNFVVTPQAAIFNMGDDRYNPGYY